MFARWLWPTVGAALRRDGLSKSRRKAAPTVFRNVAALERSDNVAESGHAFAVLKRGYTLRVVIVQEKCAAPSFLEAMPFVCLLILARPLMTGG